MPDETKAVAQSNGAFAVQVRLRALEGTNQPVSANYATAMVAPGIAFLDFGFLEPGAMASIAGSVRTGMPVPKTLEGKLAVRVAVGYDVLQNLHRQIGQVLAGLAAQAQTRRNGSAETAKVEGMSQKS